MKALFFAILLGSLSAIAAGPQFEIISGEVASAHGGPFNTGTVSIDYTANEASLHINRNRCPKGLICTMEVKAPFITTLPIVSVEVGNCNIKTVIAESDLRPADGLLEQLVIMDFSGNTCPTFTEIVGTAEYFTSGYRTPQGLKPDSISKMNTKLIDPGASVLLEKVTTVHFAPPQYQGTFRLQILDNGFIRRINNNDEVSILGHLTETDLAKALKLVQTLGAVHLTTPNTPICMDAPSYVITVHQGTQERSIWTRGGCRESKTKNKKANALIQLINKIEQQHPKN